MQKIATSEQVSTLYKEERGQFDFTYIFDTYYKRLYNFNYYRTHQQVVAEDLTSATFEKAFSKISSFDESKSSFEVWLFTIARNVLNDFFRSQKRHPWDSLDTVFEMISGEPSLETHVIQNEEKEKLLEAVKKLKDKDRRLIAYKYGAGLKNKEIAVLTGMKEKTVGTNLYRILKRMRKDLEEVSYETK